ncbi:hypothetical protein CYMTET_26520 [Cymbomonas tetramitiformis]|uniref:Uncharacterized protein n=1 Tax=Cymbomonas tetramitiformis TaxID=36881 RepID=A0AAE0FBP7_9CHLO|nr:hypothetical protein CYMTET_34146 [Cymbomonas tetramitiformis]KAK3264761.1 hypothetical protein CYMTET_26520 [Cymbomonas tetramitiformis]
MRGGIEVACVAHAQCAGAAHESGSNTTWMNQSTFGAGSGAVAMTKRGLSSGKHLCGYHCIQKNPQNLNFVVTLEDAAGLAVSFATRDRPRVRKPSYEHDGLLRGLQKAGMVRPAPTESRLARPEWKVSSWRYFTALSYVVKEHTEDAGYRVRGRQLTTMQRNFGRVGRAGDTESLVRVKGELEIIQVGDVPAGVRFLNLTLRAKLDKLGIGRKKARIYVQGNKQVSRV